MYLTSQVGTEQLEMESTEARQAGTGDYKRTV